MQNQTQTAKKQQTPSQEQKTPLNKARQDSTQAQLAAMLSAVGVLNLPQLGEGIVRSAGALGNQAAISLLETNSDTNERIQNEGNILSGAAVPAFADNAPVNAAEPAEIAAPFSAQAVPVFADAPACDFSSAQAIAAPFA